MARRRSKIWIPKSVNRIKSIIALFIDTHPAGLAVLTGRCRWPDPEEMHEMIAFHALITTQVSRYRAGGRFTKRRGR